MTIPYDFKNPDIDKLDLAAKASLLDEWSRALRYSGVGMSKRIPWDDCATNAFTDIGNGLVLRIDIASLGGEAAALAQYANVGLKYYAFFPRVGGYCAFGKPLCIARVDFRAATPAFTYAGANLQLRTAINMTAFSSQYMPNAFTPAVVEFAVDTVGFTNNANSARGKWGILNLGFDFAGRIYVRATAAGATPGAQIFPSINLGYKAMDLSSGANSTFALQDCEAGSDNEDGKLYALLYSSPSLTLLPQKFKLVYPDSWFV